MNKIRPGLLAAVLSQAFMPLAWAQTTEKSRNYGVGLGLEASRTWDNNGVRTDRASANASLLFMNHHFHFGPTASYNRSYALDYQVTSYGIGAMGRWTYEDLQTADRTPFVELSGYINKGEGSGWEDDLTIVEAGIGYEIFLNPYVSLAPSINFRKLWDKWDTTDHPTIEKTMADSSARLRLGLNVYLQP